MAVQLRSDDFQKLVRILEKDENFRDVSGRVRLITGAIEGSPRADDILAQLNLDGTPRGVAVEVIRRLSNFGRVTTDKEALGIFLNYLLFFKGSEDEGANFIRSLFSTYSLDRPIISDHKLDDWKGDDTYTSVQEKIIGEDTLRHVYMLELALEAAKAVVHIAVPGGVGSGFMIAPDLVMTNHHVIGDKAVATSGSYTFNYELDRAGRPKQTSVVSARPHGVFYTDELLDYTVVQLADVPVFSEPLRLKSVSMHNNERVAIIQHPGGYYKKISMQNNFVAYADQRIVHYTTSTMPGSSGSPVFNEDFQVVAIHHSGGMLEEPMTQRRYLRNAGSSMIAILENLQIFVPEIYSQVRQTT